MNSPLPFLDEKKQPGAVAGPESGDPGLEACAQELITAIKAQDPKAVAAALKNAHALCESAEPESE